MKPLSTLDLEQILAETRGLWENFRGQTLFFTGASGFIGSWLLESFLFANQSLDLNARAIALTRDKLTFDEKYPFLASNPCVHVVEGDVSTFNLTTGAPYGILHCAGNPIPGITYLSDLETVVQGTKRILELAEKSRSKYLLFISSGAVYGEKTEPHPVSETTSFTALSDDPFKRQYAEAKRRAEQICLAQQNNHADTHITIARCFAFFGPRLPHKHYAMGSFMRDALEGRTVQVAGDGTPIRSYLYAAEMTSWLWNIMVRGRPGTCYNVGSDVPITIAQTAAKISEIFDVEYKVLKPRLNPEEYRAHSYVPSTALLKEELGLSQKINLEEGIKRTAQWSLEENT